jgi:hypothetical protein
MNLSSLIVVPKISRGDYWSDVVFVVDKLVIKIWKTRSWSTYVKVHDNVGPVSNRAPF